MTNSVNSGALAQDAFPKAGDFEHALSEMCVRVPVAAGAGALAKELARLAPQLCFRQVLTRGGWYRLGGVVGRDGERVADDLAGWVEAQLALRDDDFHALFDDYSGSGLRATRLSGQTHYLVAATGDTADGFVQVEIEELQETVSHVLFEGHVPASLEALFETPEVSLPPDEPVSPPFFSLRRMTHVPELLKRIAAQKPEPQNIHRFFDAWLASSAGSTTHFSNHWVLAIREYLDRYRQSILQATPVAALNGLPPKFTSAYGAKGLALNEALQRFDRQAGYPMAWFFHMLTTKGVPQAVAHAVIDDVLGGFHYLPERDVKVLRDWLHRPFAF